MMIGGTNESEMKDMRDYLEIGKELASYSLFCSVLIGRAQPKPVNLDKVAGSLSCPTCGNGRGLIGLDSSKNLYCGRCGQKLDWGDDDGK